MQYEYKTRGVCASKILFDLDGDTVSNIRFIGGCSGNTQGLCRLVKGMQAQDAIDCMEGIRCGNKATSCPDQLAKALKIALAEEQKRKDA